MLRLGFTEEADAFMRWLSERIGERHDDDSELGPLRVLYDIYGELIDSVYLLNKYGDGISAPPGTTSRGPSSG